MRPLVATYLAVSMKHSHSWHYRYFIQLQRRESQQQARKWHQNYGLGLLIGKGKLTRLALQLRTI